ncbi:OmpA family protein [Halocynthiibacter namhaensis]|uniref:OmpA family protein n=1 Tax=Halocynthiibacter namhaensis TaxID=1290553 RepID=UPI0005798272|nr:OmpA family protein [Halocynthiibacter namhaensis]
MIRVKSSVAVLCASTIALTACMTPGPEPRNGNSRAQNGALIGAGIGAVLGGTKDSGSDRLKNAAIGGVLGGLVGAGVGGLLDRQADELRRDLGNDVNVVNNGDSLTVSMPQDILFATNSANLRGDLQGDLRTLANSLNQYPDSTVDIIGHTDNTGEASYNQDLSSRRATSVASVLRNSGVSGNRIRAFGRGENEPVATNLTTEGRAQNRRVDIIISPTN